MADRNTKKPKEPRRRGSRKTKAVVELRVRQVYSWLVAGRRTHEIYRLVSEAQRREVMKRAEARVKIAAAEREQAEQTAAGTVVTVELPELPPLVWGEQDPPGDRQIDHYIAKAKTLMEGEGRELSKSAIAVLGWTWARMNALYNRALKDGKLTVCVRLLEIAVDVFGLSGAIKPNFIVPGDSTTESGKPDNPSTAPESTYTLEQLEHEWMTLGRMAIARSMRNGSSAPPSGQQIKQIAPPHENGNSNGSNGTA